MGSDRTLAFFVPAWDSHTFFDAAPALSEAGFVPEISWEAMVREVGRLTGRDEEGGLPMRRDGIEAWFSLEHYEELWVVHLSVKMAWFEQHHEDWRPRMVKVAKAFNATQVIVYAGENGEKPTHIADDGDLAELLAKESIAEVWLPEGELATVPFETLAGYRLFRSVAGERLDPHRE